MRTSEELKQYLESVEADLSTQRSKALGQDRPFEDFLPQESGGWKAEEKAAYLTKLLLFALTKAEPVVSILPELEESRDWLHALILFLLEKCNPEDRTFASMKRILDLEEDTREMMFSSGEYSALLTEPPYLLTRFDLAVLHLLNARNYAFVAMKIENPGD